jgi:formate C-acetyltransferase
LNDETAIAALMNDGYSEQDARDYCLVGCVEPSGNGDSYGATGGSKVYFPTAIDLVMNRGRTSFFGKLDGPDTGAPTEMATFDDFLAAYFRQLEAMVESVTEATRLRDEIWAARFHNPLISCTIDGCIDNAHDMTAGGARYNFGSVGGGGLATAVDALAAIRHFVFEERSITMAARARLLGGPRFGNDDEHVDTLARDVVARFCAMVAARKTACGGHYKASLISYGLNIYEGALEPASADGRRAGEPLSNSMSPQNGAEKRGPTAALRSLARIDQTRIGFGNSVNMRLPLGLLQTDKGLDSVAHLVRGYFDMGGFHLQLNTVDTATLRAAQQDPAAYADLIVRVSGYSAYFTRLGRRIQDDIIGRAELAA